LSSIVNLEKPLGTGDGCTEIEFEPYRDQDKTRRQEDDEAQPDRPTHDEFVEILLLLPDDLATRFPSRDLAFVGFTRVLAVEQPAISERHAERLVKLHARYESARVSFHAMTRIPDSILASM
jgi:hypothetical protein